jgi:hypothetical protein
MRANTGNLFFHAVTRRASLSEAPRNHSNLVRTVAELFPERSAADRKSQESQSYNTAHSMSDEQVSMITVVQLPPRRSHLTEMDLCGWISQAMPGDVLEYYRGFLAMDTFSHGSRLSARDRVELVRLARRALLASERELIHLVQRRHAADDYSYLAIERAKPSTTSASLSSVLLAEVA